MANEGGEPVCDVFGRPFVLPVDAEHRATKLKILSAANPHMRQFHASWFSFFTTFVSTFAVAPLMSYVKADLKLTKEDIGNSGVASVSATVIFRNIMGVVCDRVGPRYGMTLLLLSTIPAVVGELTMNNIASLYFQEYHGMPVVTAGLLASLYGLMNLFARSVGGIMSDWADLKYGMRGRLWCLWILQTGEGVACVLLGLATGAGVAVCVTIMVIFSLFVQAAEGASYGVVPFVSKEALGVVSGMIGAGGNLGAVINTSLWFRGRYETDTGIVYMGIYIVAVTALCFALYFPESGGMLFKAGSLPYNPQLYKTKKEMGASIDFSKGCAVKDGPAEAEQETTV
mmetsp:Transcript_14667/g.46158  ORF Transcript_14667/g.46158 Transcript_14667/m.46158 type:complete len:342 (-) Transcript_14667:476-1501(-)